LATFTTKPTGSWSVTVGLGQAASLYGRTFRVQGVLFASVGALATTNALDLTLGY